MQVDFAFICDHAEAGPKLHAHGIGIDTLFLSEVPGHFIAFFFVAQLAASAAEVGTKEIQIKLLGPDGQVLVETAAQLPIQRSPIPGQPSRNRVAMQFANVEFPSYGTYAVHLLANGQDMTSVSFMVSPPPGTASA